MVPVRPSRKSPAIRRWSGRVALVAVSRAAVVAAALTLAAAVVAPVGARADAGTWGPDAIPYRNGVVCDGRSVNTALVSWTGSDGGIAFGLSPIQSGSGRTGEPATAGVAVPVAPSQTGLDATTVSELAYLISRHGADPSAGVVADVAADVLNLADAESATVDDCLAGGTGGAAPSVADSLLTEAGRLAGPYSVSLTGPTTAAPAGTAIPLVARVTSAAGYPVPGMTVDLSTAGAGVSVSASAVPTGSNGEATVTARTTSGQPAADAAVTASVRAPAGLVETSSGEDVPLVEAGAPRRYSDRLPLTVDAAPDPTLQLATASPLLLSGGRLGQTLTVTGMNGHDGVATVSLYGPLSLPAGGCGADTPPDWAAARADGRLAAAPQVTITGDGSYPVDGTTALSPGCYQAVAHLQTVDATPNVSAQTTGAVVTVAPVAVTAAPGHGGIAPAGDLTTTLRATGRFTASWQDVQGSVVGPRAPTASGRCPTTGWGSAPVATAVDSTGDATSTGSDPPDGTSSAPAPSAPASSVPATTTSAPSVDADAVDTASVDVTSGAVEAPGCYAFRLGATIVLPGLGSTTVGVEPGTQSAPLLVVVPTVSVQQLSGSGVDSGGTVSAAVTVSQSEGQPGSLRLELLRLPYTYRGCFGADWHSASVVDTAAQAPVRTTDGDDTYRVSSAPVPGSACWTVVPVFTASANPAVRAQAIAGEDPMLAFTSTVRPTSDVLVSRTPRVAGGLARQVAVGTGTGVAVLVIVLATALAARRGRRLETIDPRDRLLA